MGKIKRSKTSRIHQKANFQSNDEDSEIITKETNTNNNTYSTQKPKVENAISLEQNPFSGLNININNLFTQSLAENVEVNQTDEKSEKLKPKTDIVEKKKDKMKRRKEEFLKKLSTSYAAEAKKKKNKARANVPVVGNMVQLKEALPIFQPTQQKPESEGLKNKATSVPVEKKKALNSTLKPQIAKPKKMKQRKKQKLELLEIQRFQSLVKAGGINSVNLQALNMT
uniref:Uncharacterized protein LOC100179345 n=1 Tax=Phallusia mammillata TaxID=59560 RepID=A0A6F9DHR9_9ASCI|nr:uncharacterized protein LOC100179345 [Phallusia mammillata]